VISQHNLLIPNLDHRKGQSLVVTYSYHMLSISITEKAVSGNQKYVPL